LSGLSDRPWPLFDRKPQHPHASARGHSLRRPLLARRHPGWQFLCDNPSAMSWLKRAPQPVSSTIARLPQPSVGMGSFPGGRN